LPIEEKAEKGWGKDCGSQYRKRLQERFLSFLLATLREMKTN
jgi:hypothetical protein